MATTQKTKAAFSNDLGFAFSKPWGAYWMVLVRLIVGYWFLHAGAGKLIEGNFSAAWFVGQEGKLLSPIMGMFSSGFGLELVNFMIPVGQFMIGLGLIVGLFVRVAAFFGAVLMTFFWTTNADWAHGIVSGDFLGLVLFVTLIVFSAGRVLGLDAYVENLDIVKRNTWMRYLLG